MFGGAAMSAAAGGSLWLPPKNCFSPLAALEAVSGGGPCPAEPTCGPSDLDGYPQAANSVLQGSAMGYLDVVPFTVEVKRWPQRVQAAA